MPSQVITLIAVSAVMFLVIGGLAFISHYYTLDGIKSKTVGDGQHGTARWATKQEIRQTYAHIPFEPELWRKGEHLPEKQGLILGCEGPRIMSLLWWTLMTSMPWSPLPAALVRQRSFYTPTLNMPLRLGCPFSALIPREICTATMQALQKISMVIRLLCWTSEIPLGQMVTTYSISSTSIWTSTKPIPTTWLQRQKRRSIPRSWPRH